MLQDLTLTVVTGPPETGKFTTAKLLQILFGPPDIICVSTGQILKEHIKKHTSIGLRIAEMRNGKELAPGCYIPDELVIPAVEQSLDLLSPATQVARVILSGFPKTKAQAACLDRWEVTGVLDVMALPQHSRPKNGKGVIHLEVGWLCYMHHTLEMLELLPPARVIHLDRAKPVLNRLEAAIPAITVDPAEQVRMYRSLHDKHHPVHAQIARIRT